MLQATTLQDRYNINTQLEHLQAKYAGTGHPDTSRFEWNVNIKRDSYASLIGHHSLASYHAVAENESIGRMKYTFLQARAVTPAAGLLGRWQPQRCSAPAPTAGAPPPPLQNMLLPCGLPPEKEEE
jgi:splicing factor 3B subunit 5